MALNRRGRICRKHVKKSDQEEQDLAAAKPGWRSVSLGTLGRGRYTEKSKKARVERNKASWLRGRPEWRSIPFGSLRHVRREKR